MASLKQQTVISKYTDTAKECIREEPPYVFQYKNSPFIITYSAKLDNKLTEHRCGERISYSGFIQMEAFYYTVGKVKNITGLTLSALFIETCNAEYRLHSIMSEIFREENKINLTDTEGRSHSYGVLPQVHGGAAPPM